MGSGILRRIRSLALIVFEFFWTRIFAWAGKISRSICTTVYATGVGELKNVSRHWKFLLGGGVVTLIVLVYTLRYHSSWPLIIWVILVAGLFAATFPVWRDKK